MEGRDETQRASTVAPAVAGRLRDGAGARRAGRSRRRRRSARRRSTRRRAGRRDGCPPASRRAGGTCGRRARRGRRSGRPRDPSNSADPAGACDRDLAARGVDGVHDARPLPQPFGDRAVLDDLGEHHVHADADREDRAATGEAAVDHLVGTDRPQGGHHVRGRSAAGDHQAVGDEGGPLVGGDDDARTGVGQRLRQRSRGRRRRGRARRRGAEQAPGHGTRGRGTARTDAGPRDEVRRTGSVDRSGSGAGQGQAIPAPSRCRRTRRTSTRPPPSSPLYGALATVTVEPLCERHPVPEVVDRLPGGEGPADRPAAQHRGAGVLHGHRGLEAALPRPGDRRGSPCSPAVPGSGSRSGSAWTSAWVVGFWVGWVPPVVTEKLFSVESGAADPRLEAGLDAGEVPAGRAEPAADDVLPEVVDRGSVAEAVGLSDGRRR